MSWKLAAKLKAQLEKEKGCYIFPAGQRERMALVYPNSYFVGMSNLGIHIIYDLMNRRNDTACERFFLPEKKELDEYRRTNTPLMSLETQTPLAEFSLIAFAVSFEMDYFNLMDILSVGRVPLLASERGDSSPLVIAGGPCATFNPEPLSDFIDAFIIGEGEEIMQHFMDAYYAAKADGAGKKELLKRLAEVDGVYVPSLYEHNFSEDGTLTSITPLEDAPEKVHRQWVKNLDEYPAHTVVVTDDTEFNLYLVETARGCGRHCRFCMAGYCFRRPRNRSLEVLQEEFRDGEKYGKRFGLMGAAISDYPEIDALCEGIISTGNTMSVASFRADSVTAVLVDSLVKSGMRTLTLAPEAGSPRMRSVINKGITEGHLFHTLDLGLDAGIRHYRLYIMIGLPMETAEDIDAIADLTLRMKDYLEKKDKKTTLTLSVNPFIPKPFTPFQWSPMADKKTIEAALKRLRQGIAGHKGIDMISEPPKSALVQGVLARGDRRIAKVLCKAHEAGGAKAFLRAMKDCGLDADFYLHRTRSREECLPWSSLDMGLKDEYLWSEWERAKALKDTVPCFDGCQRCGVCGRTEE